MKVIGFDHVGGPDVFEERTVDTPQPAADELLVKVIAIGLNNRERAERAGEFGPISGFTVTGRDIVGTVESVGPNVKDFTPGEVVASHVENGYAEYVVAQPSATTPVPSGIMPTTAAALITPGITAYRAITTFAHVTAGQTVIVKGASGGVGALALQMAVDRGAHVIAIAHSRNEAAVTALGASEFVAYDQLTPSSVLADRADVLINAAMNGAGSDDDIVMTKPGGVIATVAHNTPPANKQVTINHIHPSSTPTDAEALAVIMDLLKDGKLAINITSQLPFSATGLKQGNEILEQSHDGRVVILMDR
ncbi:NADP-dependent oxidoreductase [uncultured Secundilactobacillus sp.]|uniref:NADP-dependent oxidoreductase n=1 Tax=uncultured Secundilactobacillus sp. TaxID=2813935 RepID=UPI00258EBC1E|nr:NADP-dependent oxidoreductase [uncultured Secundilactobacillus sp.]